MEEVSFETRVEKAKEILGKLNTQNLSLKEGLELYKEGMGELESAQKMLEQAKLEYQELKNNHTQNKEKE
ncbi:exodeoxyribonuclease VII small subunit [Helicobacter sp. 11S02596-1]|uniref:exodeoxyribonuclease VII small subunit n=1 Tax=Helicobacter sp. 11S02596-1 TaxID=1476194 RepID=UPI000BA74115|nr:exodeoxyribonuclease VII small subunit [Helicobacter sp. 11S02596-1]PAF44425.1 exodeoxyribonuclease VII small subunit [Helicobacter sp. 11S02596-1]